MKKFTRLAVLFSCPAILAPWPVVAGDVVKVKWNATLREYCHDG
jgi:hypothetical protein